MATDIRRSGQNIYPLYQFFTKIIIRNVHSQNLFHFLNAVLEKFAVNLKNIWNYGIHIWNTWNMKLYMKFAIKLVDK